MKFFYANTDDNVRQARIPKNSGGIIIDWMATKKLNVNVDYSYVGTRYNDNANNTTMPNHWVTNLALNYKVNDNLKVFARVENLFDADYQLVDKYFTYDRTFYLGFKLSY